MMVFRSVWSSLPVLFSIWLCGAVSVPPALSADPVEFYRSTVKPILVKSCYACHTQTKLGGLRIDQRSALTAGGVRGPAVVAGNPGKSLLYQAVAHQHPQLRMPPQGSLSAVEIAAIATWIEQ